MQHQKRLSHLTHPLKIPLFKKAKYLKTHQHLFTQS